MNLLPDKASELIRLALTDLRAVAADPYYRVDMSDWYRQCGDYCDVCLAGAVIARQLYTEDRFVIDPSDYDVYIKEKLYALNRFRLGEVKLAGQFIEVGNVPDVEICPYHVNAEQFFADMEALAVRFENEGL